MKGLVKLLRKMTSGRLWRRGTSGLCQRLLACTEWTGDIQRSWWHFVFRKPSHSYAVWSQNYSSVFDQLQAFQFRCVYLCHQELVRHQDARYCLSSRCERAITYSGGARTRVPKLTWWRSRLCRILKADRLSLRQTQGKKSVISVLWCVVLL